MRSVIPAALAAAVFLTSTLCSAAPYVFDKRHTEVRFAYNMGLSTGRGRFTRVTVDGITKPVVLQVALRPHTRPELKYSRTAYAFTAATRIRRSDFGMTAYSSTVGDDIGIEIDAFLNKP